MDTIWDRKSFEVGGHLLLLCRGLKHRMTTQNRQSRTMKKNHPLTLAMRHCVHNISISKFTKVLVSLNGTTPFMVMNLIQFTEYNKYTAVALLS